MKLLFNGKAFARRLPLPLAKMLMIMRVTAVLILVASLHVSATGFSQTLTLSGKHLSMNGVFRQIEAQTGYSVLWNENLFDKNYTVDLNLKNAPVSKVLDLCLNGLPLTYKINGKLITIEAVKPVIETVGIEKILITGQVADETSGKPLGGATIAVKGTKLWTTADANGRFLLKDVDANAILVISYVGYESKEYPVKGSRNLSIVLSGKPTALNQTVIIGYGTTSKERNTGSVTTISAETIHAQPIGNPLMALQGQVPGMDITVTSGRPGANVSVFVRGVNSIGAGTDPLYIIDGVPFNSTPLNQFDYLGDPPVGDQSPFNSINPSDIESISVLRDADATAIYGSRGANGVVLITTKRGKYSGGKLGVTADGYEGWGNVAHFMKLMSTQQYLNIRKQAFTNDGLDYTDPSQSPPDLTVFSPTQQTDWQKLLLGHTAHITNGSLRLESGTDQSRFTLGLTYRRESTVYPGNANDQRLAANMTYDFTSLDKRFGVQLTNSYSYDNNAMISGDPANSIMAVPNQQPYTSSGALNWYGVGSLGNPLAVMNEPFDNKTSYLSSNGVIHYRVLPNLDVKVSMGYNQMIMNQLNTFPTTSSAPSAYYQPYAQFGRTNMDGWIVEPQVNYNLRLGGGELSALAGSTLQRRTTEGNYDYGYGYTSDLLLSSPAAAGSSYLSYSYADYRYASEFGRLNYDWQDKYILNWNIRRDGSSRFGPDRRYGTFSSIGGAWVFSKEEFMKGLSRTLSFGKLRASYGTVGNDQIGDYGYNANYSTPYVSAFQGIQPLVPQNLANKDFSWELDKKLNIGLELGFVDNRVMFTGDFYRNRTGNQLVGYTLPAIAGFTSVQYNLPAVIQNQGLEFEVSSTNIKSRNFTWRTSLNLTVPKNKLVDFPNLASSSYAYNYEIGQSVHVVKGYKLLHIDSSGNPVYQDIHQTGSPDRVVLGNTDPKFYGGIQNTFNYKNWNLSIMIQFDKKDGFNYLASTFSPIGSENNFDVKALEAWTTPGQKTSVPKPTTSNYDWYYYVTSSATFGDASFVRLKSVYLSYDLPKAMLAKAGISRAAVYFQGYNLLTISGYRGLDPETGGIFSPVIRTLTGGIQLSF